MATLHTTQTPNSRLGVLKNLLAGPHGPGSRIFEELAKFSNDYTYWKEDFDGPIANAVGAAERITYVESAAGPVDVAKLTPTAAKTSYAQLDIGVTDNAQANLLVAKQFAAKLQPFWSMRWQHSVAFAVNTVENFFGFCDAVPGSAAVILGDIDTPTFAACIADAAGFAIDTDQTLLTTAVQTIGTTTTVGKTTITGSGLTIPAIDTDVIYRMELRSPTADSSVSTCYAFVDNNLVANRAGPDAEKLMSLVFQFGNRVNGQGDVYQIDYIEWGQEKSGAPFL